MEPDAAPNLLEQLRTLSRAAGDAGETLPAEPTLAERLGVSRSHLREALARLEFEGVITRRRRRGTHVNTAALGIEVWLGHQEPFVETLRRLDFAAPSIETTRIGFRRLQDEEASFFDRPTGTGALDVRKRWRADGRIVMLADYVVPTPDAAGIDDIDDPSAPVFDLAERLIGAAPTWEVAHTRARTADPGLARDMEIDIGDPLLVLDLLGVSATGVRMYRTVEHHVDGAVDFGFVRTFTP